jgi:effector-binding domain-containing protein
MATKSKKYADVVTVEPHLVQRPEQHTVGIRTQIPTSKLSITIPKLLKQVSKWMEQRGIEPTDAPFLRFHVIDMAVEYDIEIGFPVEKAVQGDDTVIANTFPAGRYATVTYRGKNRGYQGNKTLVDWAYNNGIPWDRWDDPKGDAFRSRFESMITGPEDEPDTSKWLVEVYIKVADSYKP